MNFEDSLEKYETETANNLYTYKPDIAMDRTNTTMFDEDEKTLEEWLVKLLVRFFCAF